MIVKMKDTWPICQNVMHLTAQAVLANAFTGSVFLNPHDWNTLLLEVTSRPGNHWTVAEGMEKTEKVIALAVSGTVANVAASSQLKREHIEVILYPGSEAKLEVPS